MPATVLVGFDAGEQSKDALTLALRLARATGAELHVAAVLEHNPLPIDVAAFEAALARHFDEIFALARRQAKETTFTEHRLTGSSPAGELAELAEKLDADPIVIGSCHRGPIGRLLPGNVGLSLLSAGPASVLVAPRGYAASDPRMPFESIGCGFDQADESRVALGRSVELARATGARLALIAVAEPIRVGGLAYTVPTTLIEWDRTRLETEAVTAAAGIDDLEVGVEVLDGEAADVLCGRSEELDLLVLGSRGYGPLGSVLLGSVSSQVIRHAGCPVLVTRRSSGAEAEGSRPSVEAAT